MISNRDQLEASSAHELALDCIEAAIDAAAPENATSSKVAFKGKTLEVKDSTYDLGQYDDIIVVGGGKAAGGVTHALESILGDQISGGLVVTKQQAAFKHIRNSVGDHPLPSQRNVEATAEILDIVEKANERTLILFVLTGGGSSLLTAPVADLTVSDLRDTTELLLEGGVPIEDINVVRKHLSEGKGGQIARKAAPATCVGLLLSDVVGNDLSTIGSGPTVPDETTYADALAVFDQYGLDPAEDVRHHLKDGDDSTSAETPSSGDPAFERVDNFLIADNGVGLDAARDVAANAGYTPLVLSSRFRGEAREIAKSLVALAEEAAAKGRPVEPPAVLIAGGECTVTVSGKGGQGGPNQELVLSAAIECPDNVVIAAIDTDGEDGSSDAAGAITDETTVPREERENARVSLNGNDAGAYLSNAGATIRTGPTGTNVNDIQIIVLS